MWDSFLAWRQGVERIDGKPLTTVPILARGLLSEGRIGGIKPLFDR